MKKKAKITIITICSVIGCLVVSAAGYVGYIFASYYRIEDNLKLDVNSKSSINTVNANTKLSISTYNIGFGAYSQDYTFFLDTGYDEDGNETCGYYSKAKSKDEVLFNVNGAIDTIKALDVDFALFQEVDTKATRSYHVDQNSMINDSFTNYDSTFAVNYHTAFLPYPLYDMHGSVNAGLATLSKYKITSSIRKSYTVSTTFSKFFDLDRCFSYSTIEVNNGKKLYVVNSHMSAYDSGGIIREKQIGELNDFLKQCQNEGNYIIVGGDFNHDMLTYNIEYNYTKENRPFNNKTKDPEWINTFFSSDGKSPITDGYTVEAANNGPTSRNNDIAWEEGKTFVSVLDGFIVSDNVKVTLKQNIKTKNGNLGTDGFAFSDHEPVYMEFELIG